MGYDIKQGAVASHAETDPHIPLNVCFGEADYDVDRIGFYGPRGELLEVAASFDSREVKELTLVHCEGIELREGPIEVPAAGDGVVCLRAPDHNDVAVFDLAVFLDGIHVRLDKDFPDECVRMGNVVFGFNRKARSLSEVFVDGLGPEKVSEITDAVQYALSQRDVVLVFGDAPGEWE